MKNNAKTSVLALVLAGTMGLLLNAPSHAQDFADRHPRRAEVLQRDRGINHEINGEYGHLNGHYGQLHREDRAIRRQERRDARMDDGRITPGEQHRLNREENHLQRQINRDNNGHY